MQFIDCCTYELNPPYDYILNCPNNRIPGIINISIKGIEGEVLLHRLDLLGICVSTGSACNSTHTEVSHVIKAINSPPEYAHGTIRISLSKDNTDSEIVEICTAIKNILQE